MPDGGVRTPATPGGNATEGGRTYWTGEVSRTTSSKDLEYLPGLQLEEHPVIFDVMESDKHQHSQVMSDAVQSRLDQVK